MTIQYCQLMVLTLSTILCQGLILTSPRNVLDALQHPSAFGTTSTDTKIASAVKIRSTRAGDIDEIAALLATEQGGSSASGWMRSLDYLRRVASFQSLLSQRHRVMVEGNLALNRVLQEYEEASEADQLRLVWNHDSFRNKLQKVALMSNEPHIWKEHNFALCPDDSCYLQHIMLTAKAPDGTIIGFCEVAMMEAPGSASDVAPTIANLVTNSSYRRQGIAKSLIQSVTRYARQCWDAHELALYVAKDNTGAVSLYSKSGFEPLMDHNDKWYMIQKLYRDPS